MGLLVVEAALYAPKSLRLELGKHANARHHLLHSS